MKNLIVLVITLAFLLGYSQGKAQTFPLNKMIAEQSVHCFTEQAAKDIVDSDSEFVILAYLKAGVCAIVKGTVMYTRLVYHKGDLRVYQGTLWKIPIWTP